MDENIQRYVKDNKESVIQLIWEDTQYSEGYLRYSEEIVDTKYVMENVFRGLDNTEGLQQFIAELLQEVRRRKKLKIVVSN